jgi:hypothetical protein
LRLYVGIGSEDIQELLLLLVIDISITSTIAYTKDLDRFPIPLIAQRHLNPSPLLKHSLLEVARKDRNLPTRPEKLQQQAEGRGVFFLTEDSGIKKVIRLL